MRIARTTLAILVAATGLLATQSYAEARSCRQLDGATTRLERQSKQLTREIRYNYRHAPRFGRLVSESREVARRARHINDVAHGGGNLKHLKRELREIDERIHRLADLMRDIQRAVRRGQRGHFDGDIRPSRQLVREMQATVHNLRDDVRVALQQRRNHKGHRHVTARPDYVDYRAIPDRAAGFSYQGRGWSFRIGHAF